LLIERILKKMNFTMGLKADMVNGTPKKFDCALIQEKLDILPGSSAQSRSAACFLLEIRDE